MRIVLALLLGSIVDLVGSTIGQVILLFALMAAGVAPSLSGVANSHQWAAELVANSWFWWSSIVIGSAFSIIGGYVAARVARQTPVLVGALSTWSCVVMGLFALARHFDPEHLAILILTPGLGAIGGYLSRPARMGPSAPEPSAVLN